MSESRTITTISADDWIMVFADERCIWTGHSCSAIDLLEALEYEDHQHAYLEGASEDEQQELWNVLYGEPTLSEMKQRLNEAEAKGFRFGRH